MSFFGLFGHDTNPAGQGGLSQLPKAPPISPGAPSTLTGYSPAPLIPGTSLQAPPQVAQLPQAPPVSRKMGAFDDDHRSQTLLGMAAGFFGSHDFGEGMANAARAIASGNEAARAVDRPQLGGPDDAFEIYTDPKTGQHTFKPIQAVQDYAEHKRVKPLNAVDSNGRAVSAIMKLAPADRPAALDVMKANPGIYGVDPDTLPDTWDDRYGSIVGDMGMTVAQSRRQDAADQGEQDRQDYRRILAELARLRTSAQVDRSQAATEQGWARVAQGDQRVAQGAAHVALARNADRRAQAKSGGTDVIAGYQYRRDPATGKLQRRKVQ